MTPHGPDLSWMDFFLICYSIAVTIISVMQFGFRIQMKAAKEWAITYIKGQFSDHKLNCIKDADK